MSLKVKTVLICIFVIAFFGNAMASQNVESALSHFAWKKRQLIILSPSKDHPQYLKFRQIETQYAAEFLDRKLQSWHVITKNKVTLNNNVINDFSNVDIRNYFAVKEDEFRVILIGYDQYEKARQDIFDMEDLFARIDRMPMRLQELQNN